MKLGLRLSAMSIASLLLMSFDSPVKEANYGIVPLPQTVNLLQQKTPFLLNSKTIIRYEGGDKMKQNAEFLSSYIKDMTGFELKVKKGIKGDGILLKLGANTENSEGYEFEVKETNVVIAGSTEAGVFYGIQTLRKSLPMVNKENIELPAVKISDYPRFSYRGAMLDVGRHFFSVDSIKTYIDILALHNINRFHWHLSEDQGWRIEIKSHPELTKIGSKREETVIGRNSGKYDGKPYEGFYTQKQIKEIVKYASDRNITVIPEIDMPGHMLAALTAYPELGCTGGPYKVWTQWGVSDDVLCAGNDKTLRFIEDVLTEIVDLFPSEYIHVGGDECPKVRWKECPKCQARIKELGIKADAHHSAEEKLQSFIISHTEKFLNSKGRQIIGWDEILEGGLAPNATVMSWRGEAGGIEAARQKHNVVMSPNTYVYFDYYQSKDTDQEPLAIGGYLPMERVYSYEPLPKSLNKEEQKYIIGVQANIWTEYMPTFSQVEYMALPRLAALSEVQWSKAENKNYKCFINRMPHFVDIYKKYGYNYATHIFDVNATFVPNTEKETLDVTLSTIDNYPIYYTLDGTVPTKNSSLYTSKVSIGKNSTFKAKAFRENGESRVVTEKVSINKASMKPIKMLQPINEQYKFQGGSVLVDGLNGWNTNYKTGRWIGFYKNDLEAVIDLKKTENISSVSIRTCVEKGDWIFDARGMEISVSQDGKNFTRVASESYPAMKESDKNGLFNHSLKFDSVNARFVKVKALSEQSIPEWHGGKGKFGFLFVDEIVIE